MFASNRRSYQDKASRSNYSKRRTDYWKILQVNAFTMDRTASPGGSQRIERPCKTHEAGSGVGCEGRASCQREVMKTRMAQWRAKMWALKWAAENGEHSPLPPYERPAEIRHAWANWLQQADYCPEPFPGRVPLWTVPPCLRARVRRERVKHHGQNDDGGVNIESESEQQGEKKQDPPAKRTCHHHKNAHIYEREQQAHHLRQKLNRPTNSSKECASKFETSRRYARQLWQQWLEGSGEEPFPAVPLPHLTIVPPCLRKTVKERSGLREEGHNTIGQPDVGQNGSPPVAESSGIPAGTDDKRAMRQRRRQQWRDSLRSAMNCQGEGYPHFDSPRAVRLAWAKWLEEGGDLPFANMPFWMIPPCLRLQVRNKMANNKGESLNATSGDVDEAAKGVQSTPRTACKRNERDLQMQSEMRKWRSEMQAAMEEGGARFESPQAVRMAWRKWLAEGGEEPFKDAPIWMIPPCLREEVLNKKKAEDDITGKVDQMNLDESKTDTESEDQQHKCKPAMQCRMQHWRGMMRDLKHSAPSDLPVFDSPRAVRTAWVEWLEGHNKEQPYTGMPLWMIPPSIRKQVRAKLHQAGKGNGNEREPTRCEGKDGEPIHTDLARIKKEMDKWRQTVKKMIKTENQFGLESPKQIRLVWAQWLKDGGEEPFPGMSSELIPPCLRRRVHVKRSAELARESHELAARSGESGDQPSRPNCQGCGLRHKLYLVLRTRREENY